MVHLLLKDEERKSYKLEYQKYNTARMWKIDRNKYHFLQNFAI